MAGQSLTQFTNGVATSTDTAIVVRSLTSSGTNVEASVGFTSHQAAAEGPNNETCSVWSLHAGNRLRPPLGVGYLIDTVLPISGVGFMPCP